MDEKVSEAFRLNVKWSLQQIAKAINGDGKSAPNALFRVEVTLDEDKVEFSPTLKQLADIVSSVSDHMTNCIKPIQRLPALVAKKKLTHAPREVRKSVKILKFYL